jgi:hypothetical protein
MVDIDEEAVEDQPQEADDVMAVEGSESDFHATSDEELSDDEQYVP